MNVGLGSWQPFAKGFLYLAYICRVTFAKVRLLLEPKYNFEVSKISGDFGKWNHLKSLSSKTFCISATELLLKESKKT